MNRKVLALRTIIRFEGGSRRPSVLVNGSQIVVARRFERPNLHFLCNESIADFLMKLLWCVNAP